MRIKFCFSRTIKDIIVLVFILVLGVVIECTKTTPVQTASSNSISLPIIMYHSFLKDTSLQNDYCIDPSTLESDLKYVNDNGYTTVTASDLVNYVNGSKLDEKIIMLTFDDGFYNNYYYAYPLLKKYNCKAVISVITSLAEQYSDNEEISPTYGYCSFKELKEMQDSGLVEVANHTYDMHELSPRKGILKIDTEDAGSYRKVLKKDIKLAQNLFISNSIKEPICFAYPYGAVSKIGEKIVKNSGFKCTLTCTEKTNLIYPDKSCLYGLGRYNRTQEESSNTFFERICS